MSTSHQSTNRTRWLLAVIAVALGFYLLLLPGILDRLTPLTGDEPFYVMTAVSLIRDGDLDESNNYAQGDFEEFYPDEPLPADWSGWAGFPRPLPPHPATSDLPGLHTKHGIGLSVLIAIPFEILGRIGATMVIVICAALLAGQMFLLARESGASSALAAAIAVGLAIAMPIGPYAFLIFPAIPSALLLTYAIRRIAIRRNTATQWLLAGLAVGFLPWLHQRFAPTAAILATIILIYAVRSHRWRAAALGLTPVAIGGISLMLYNLWLYGIPFQRVEDHAGFSGIPGTINGAFGLLLDAQWGLWIAAPVTLLALAAVPRWVKANRPLALMSFAATIPYFIIVAAYAVWWGEWGPPARYLVTIVPLAAGPLASWLTQASPAGKMVAAGAWLIGMVVTAVGFSDPQRFYHHPDGINKLYAHIGDVIGIEFNRLLVAFQPYAVDSLLARLWIGVFAVALLALAAILINNPHSESPGWLEQIRIKLASPANR